MAIIDNQLQKDINELFTILCSALDLNKAIEQAAEIILNESKGGNI